MAATIHTTAVVEPGARIDSLAVIGPFCSIGRDVVINPGVRVEPQIVLEGEVVIGQGPSIGAGAVIRGRAVIGHQGDRNSQHLVLLHMEQLQAAGAEPSVGNVGDLATHALAETRNGSFKAGAIHRHAPRRSLETVQ